MYNSRSWEGWIWYSSSIQSKQTNSLHYFHSKLDDIPTPKFSSTMQLIDFVRCKKHVGYWFLNEVDMSAMSTDHFPFVDFRLLLVGSSRKMPPRVLNAITAGSVRRSPVLSFLVFLVEGWYFQAIFQPRSQRPYLNSSPYKGRPVYSRQNIDQELRIIIHLYGHQLDVLEL